MSAGPGRQVASDEPEPSIEELIERSSLGTPEARALRESVDPEIARRIVAASMSPYCDWCGRAIRPDGDRWVAVKGVERGYDPLACDANTDDGRHEP